MLDYLTIGSSPAGESCAQVGSGDYHELSRKECRAFINQLKRQFGDGGRAYFKMKSFPHDFGSYMEVCVIFSDQDEEGQAWAYKVEAESPEFWDGEAKKELGLAVAPGA